MAKLGRRKKNILEYNDLLDFKNFQTTLRENACRIGYNELSSKERAFFDEFVVNDCDSEFVRKQKMYKFKHVVLKKPLTHDECTYLVNVNEKGLRPSAEKKLSKMRICTLESSAMAKLNRAMKDKFNISALNEFMLSGEDRSMPAKQFNCKEV